MTGRLQQSKPASHLDGGESSSRMLSVETLRIAATAQTHAAPPSAKANALARTVSPSREPDEAHRDRVCSLFRRAEVPKRHREQVAALTSEKSAHDWQDKLDMLESKLGSGFLFLLSGNRGVGKSQLCACLCWLAAQRMIEPRYTTAMDLFLELRGCYGQAGGREAEVLRRYCGRTDSQRESPPGLLIVDEAHERGQSEWEDRMLTYIVDKRYAWQLDTILVTNESADRAAVTLGSSIIDRLRETGACVECNWPSFRANSRKGIT